MALIKLDVRVQNASSELGLVLPFCSLLDVSHLRVQQDANRRFHLNTSELQGSFFPFLVDTLELSLLSSDWFIYSDLKQCFCPGQYDADWVLPGHVCNLAPAQELVHGNFKDQQQKRGSFSRKIGVKIPDTE